jgi:hypothetical protein
MKKRLKFAKQSCIIRTIMVIITNKTVWQLNSIGASIWCFFLFVDFNDLKEKL